MANNTTGFTRIIKAAGYSWKGLRAAWINEAAFRQEGVAVLLAVVIACWLDVDAITRVLLISSVMLVMIVEILNSAIEAVVDRIGSEYHELSGRAKDMGSAAVLIAIIVAVITWCILLWSHFGYPFQNSINLWFIVQFMVPKSPFAVYTHSITVYTPRGRNESVNGQATRGV